MLFRPKLSRREPPHRARLSPGAPHNTSLAYSRPARTTPHRMHSRLLQAEPSSPAPMPPFPLHASPTRALPHRTSRHPTQCRLIPIATRDLVERATRRIDLINVLASREMFMFIEISPIPIRPHELDISSLPLCGERVRSDLLSTRDLVRSRAKSCKHSHTRRGIIEMPARHNQEHRSIVCEARQKIIRQPAPGLVAHEQRACLSAALDRIVNHADVQRLTSDGAADSRVAEKSLTIFKFDQLLSLLAPHFIIRKDRPKRTDEFGATEYPLHTEICSRAQPVAERCEYDLEIVILASNPRQEINYGN